MATSSKTLHEVIKTYENWFHYGMFVIGPLKESLRNVLHKRLPINPVRLYGELEQHRNALNNLLSEDQMALLFPANNLQTDSANFDIPLLAVLIMHCTNLSKLFWWNATTTSIGDSVIHASKLNDAFHHAIPAHLDKQTFDAKWEEGDNVVKSLGYTYDSQALKTEPLYPEKLSVMHLLVLFLQYEQRELKRKINSINEDINFRRQNAARYFYLWPKPF